LLEGLDDIDLTLKEDEKIEYFEKNSSRISISISSSSEFD
jgi:3-isopropylmalate dehydratase small subunit